MSEKDKKQIELLMKCLDITEDEAIQVLKDDKAIDKGEKLFEQTPEQKGKKTCNEVCFISKGCRQ